jgi:Uma2 family endonuclease
MPSDRHQSMVGYLYMVFLTYTQRFGGKVLFAPIRLRLWPGKVHEPDLVYLASASDPRRQNDYWLGADLVLEVVSPDDPGRALVDKRLEYARAGIPEYWIVNPQTETTTVLKLENHEYVEYGHFARGNLVVSAQFPALQVPVNQVLDVT